MRRSWAFTSFGGVVTLLALGTATSGSKAAGNLGPPSMPVANTADGLDLFSVRDEPRPLFASFLDEHESPAAVPSDEPCPGDMVEVEGDYCPQIEQHCLRWLDPKSKLQCAEFERTPG